MCHTQMSKEFVALLKQFDTLLPFASNRSAQTFLRVVLRSKRARLTGKTCTFDRQNMHS